MSAISAANTQGLGVARVDARPTMQKTIMGYVPTSSPMYSMHPVGRLTLYLVFSVVPLFIERPEVNLLLIVLTLLMFRYANVQFKTLKMFLPMFVTVFFILNLTYIVFPREDDLLTTAFSAGPFTVYSGSLVWAFATYCRIIALVLASIFYFSTNRESDILVGLRTLGMPWVVSYFIGLSLRSVGVFLEDYAVIKEAEIARGLDTRDLSPAGKVKHFAMNLIPLFALSIRRSEDISMGLYAKGVRISNKVNGRRRPDWMRTKYTMRTRDWALVAFSLAAFVVIVALRTTTSYLTIEDSFLYGFTGVQA